MEIEKYFGSSYNNKGFTQHDITSAGNKGFGSVADQYSECDIDLNEQLIRNKAATFFMRMSGNSMINAGIYNGDIVIVDKSLKPQNGKIVIAVIDGEMLIRRYEKTINSLRLIPETAKLSPIEVNEFCDFKIWGVVICIIRNV